VNGWSSAGRRLAELWSAGEKTSDGHVARIPVSPGGGGARTDVIAPPPGELFSETNDNSVAILLTYSSARVLLSGDAEAREEERRQAVRTRGLERSSTFPKYTQSAPGFRALLTARTPEIELALV